jgi:hypothetical protein
MDSGISSTAIKFNDAGPTIVIKAAIPKKAEPISL